MVPQSGRDLNWIDGLRGIASSLVVCGHLCTAFAPWIHSPALKDETPSLIQLPYFRLCVGGRSGVAIFFIITGYVNALSSISKSRAGNPDAAFINISKSALARTGKLVLPAVFATIFSWILANLNSYKMSENIDSVWIRQGYHKQESNIFMAIISLIRAIIQTWTTGWNEYDGTQWTLVLFLQSSMTVYTVSLATTLVAPKTRRIIFGLLYLYFWICGDALKGMNTMVGMMIADLQIEYSSNTSTAVPCTVPSFLIVAGMFMCCYPQDAVENARWSSAMRDIMLSITPESADLRRFWDSLGSSCVVLGIFLHAGVKRTLGGEIFNFLGRVSFPVYLLHNQLMKSLLTWMIYLPSALKHPLDVDSKELVLERGSTVHMALSIVIFYVVLYRLAYWWSYYIDPICASIVNWLTKKAYGDGSLTEKPVLAL